MQTAWVLSRFSLVQLFLTLWVVAFQAPLSMGVSRQGYWRGLPCPHQGDLSHPGIEPASLHCRQILYGWATEEALYAQYPMWNVRLDESQTGIKIAGRNIINLLYADTILMTDTILMAESEEELKSSWWRSKSRVKKLASSSTFKKLRSWHLVTSLHGKKMGQEENVNSDRFYFLGLQNHCGWWLQPWTLVPWKKNYDKSSQCIKNQRYYFANKDSYSQSYGFSSS